MKVQLRRLGPVTKIKNLNAPADGSAKVWLGGRGTCCHIYTRSKYASRKHFSITFRNNKYFISDLQSINGTFLNDVKINSEKVLNFGDKVSIGVPTSMQDIPDGLVYVFELLNDESVPVDSSTPGSSQDDDIYIIKEMLPNLNKPNTSAQPIKIEMDIDNILPSQSQNNSSVNKKKEDETIVKSSQNEKIKNESLKRPRNSSSPGIEVETKVRKITKTKEEPIQNDDSQNEVEVLEEKLVSNCDNRIESVKKELDDDPYQVATQVDDVKTEEDLLNYSLTEELIEINDSDDEDWSLKDLKPKVSEDLDEEEEEEEEDVIFIEEIIKSMETTDLFLPTVPKIEDDLTETDKKWMGKLFKIKEEPVEDEVAEQLENVTLEELVDGATAEIPIREQINDQSAFSDTTNDLHSTTLSKISDADKPIESASVVEGPKRTKKIGSKKSVSFDLVPKIKYFEIPGKVKLTAVEKGKIKFSKIIVTICKWNTAWLEECKKVAPGKIPPDVCDEPLRKIPKKFVSHSVYMSSFIPAMLLNLWNKVKENWKQFGEEAFRQTVSLDTFEDYENQNLSVYKCTGLVQNIDAHRQLIKEGHLVMLRLHQVHNPSGPPTGKNYSKKFGYLVFGFVQKKTYEKYNEQSIHEAFADRCLSTKSDLHLVKLTLSVKMRPNLKVDQKKLIQVTVVDYISTEIRKFRGICFLPKSPLCKAILLPTKSDFSLITSSNIKEPFFKGPLDKHQKEIVLNLAHTFNSTDSFMYSLHGAAGTGKGQVILALISELLCSKNLRSSVKPKVFYCTPSNAPLDEMVRKLKGLRDSLGEPHKFNIVRVGSTKDVKPDIQDVFLSNLAKNRPTLNKGLTKGRKNDPEVQVLKQSDVICTTCSSSGMYKVVWAFENRLPRNNKQKLICILDEAMQGSEPTSLLPLLLGVTHLLLVGDRYQFTPPFSEEKTNGLGLDIPLFWRVYKNFTSIPQDLWAVCELKTQYRMNPGIGKFLANFVYNNEMEISAQNVLHKVPHLQSHVMLVDDVPEDLLKKDKDIREKQILVQLVKAILNIINRSGKTFKVSIITCDSKQSQFLLPYLPKNKFPNLEINPIFKYQGRETDVVVFPYSGNKISMDEITVAVTRAKCSLIILTNRLAIAGNLWFLKISGEAEKQKILKCVSPEMTSETLEKFISF